MSTSGGTTHIKTILIFSPDMGMNFTDNALCSPDNSVTHLIHILDFFYGKQCPLQTQDEKKIQRSQIWRTRYPRNEFPSCCVKIRKSPYLERHKHNRRTEVMYDLTGKLFPQRHDAKYCSPS
jgi:hypothetical protein